MSDQATQNPLILVIDDSPTIRKMVECHLSEAGYRLAFAQDAERGLEMAARIGPDLILLDHQLPGTTGDEVCRRLLQSEATSRVPVVISSSMRHKAFAQYAEFSNVIDQIPKPFTPDLLRSGVSNALHIGAMVVRAQESGGAMPEAVDQAEDSVMEGRTDAIPLRALFDFLTNGQFDGRLTLEQGKERIKFALASGRIQAVFSTTVRPERLMNYLPDDLADLGPLLSVTLGENQDASMAGLVRLLERSLSDPKRLRSLLRFQAAVLTYLALTGEPGRFVVEARKSLPPMFQAFPLQLSLPALAVEGVRRCVAAEELAGLVTCHFARQTPRGGNVDRVGLAAGDVRLHTLLDGTDPLMIVAEKAGLSPIEAAATVRGLELVAQAERRTASSGTSILLVEDDPDTARLVQRVLGAEGEGFNVRHVRDRVAAQLLLRRQPFSLVIMTIETPEHEAFYQSLREHVPGTTRVVGVVKIDEESQLDRLDGLGLDGVIHRPVTEPDLRATVRQLFKQLQHAGAA